MADFDLALPTIFLHEGRLVNNKNDPGGITNFGISLRFLLKTGDLDHDGRFDGDINRDGIIDAEDIKKMTQDQAAKLYELYFWNTNGYAAIGDQAIATKAVDFAINMGAVGAGKVLQRAVRAAIGIKLDDDGKLGLRSITAINMSEPAVLLAAIKSEAAGFYRSINYKGSQDFIAGWLNRAYSNPIP